MNKELRIEIVSDFVCPWCYVGKKRLEAALKKFVVLQPDVQTTISWQPFQLSPDMPREGRNKLEHYREIFGEERALQIAESMRDTGIEEGIAFGVSPDAVSPNTLSAHVLLLWATEDDAVDANAVAEQLFHAHHVECADIGSHDVLAGIAEIAGMNSAEVRRNLAEGVDEVRVQEQIDIAKTRGVSGVPFFVLNDRYGLSGAQPPEVLAETFEQILAEGAAA